MTDKYAIYSGSTNNSAPAKFYWKGQKYKNLFCYAKNLTEAKNKFKKAMELEECRWAQLLCLTTFNIIQTEISIDVNKPCYKEYYDSDDEYEYEKRQYIK